MNADQILGPIRALIPLLITLLTYIGLDDANAAAIAGAIGVIASAAWSWYSNRAASMAVIVSNEPGIVVEVGPKADDQMLKLARNPDLPGIRKKGAY